jgi:hypothetical protein
MPIVTCPGCERKIELPFHELAMNIRCKMCGVCFVPAGSLGTPPPIRRAEATPVDDEIIEPSPIPDSPIENVGRSISPVQVFGFILVCIGLALIGFFWLVYDTTVPVYRPARSPYEPGIVVEERVYNTGKQQDRLVGIIVGFGSIAGGTTLLIAGKRRS